MQCLGSERDARIYTINLLEMQSFNYVSKGLEKEKKKSWISIWLNSLQLMIKPKLVTSFSASVSIFYIYAILGSIIGT